jgi:hypothetical protein
MTPRTGAAKTEKAPGVNNGHSVSSTEQIELRLDTPDGAKSLTQAGAGQIRRAPRRVSDQLEASSDVHC